MKKSRSPRKSKTKREDFTSEKGVLEFVEGLFDEKGDIRKRAREKSAGATGGALRQLDGTIKNISAKRAIPDSLLRTMNETSQEVRNAKNSISSLETRLQDVTEQTNKTLGLLGELAQKFNDYKKDIDKKLKEFEKKIGGDGERGGILDALGSATDLLGSMLGSKQKKTAAAVSKTTTVTAKSGVLKSVGSLGKGLIARAPLVGGIVEGVAEYVEGGDLGRSIAAGAGNVLGGIIGGVLGTALAPGVGTAVGAVGGSMAGSELAKSGYDWLFGSKSPQESEAVKAARGTNEQKPEDAKRESAPTPSLFERIGKYFGLTPGGDVDTSGLKGVGETGSATEAIKFFVDKSWTQEQAAGIVGNLQAESGPSMKTDSVGDGGKAYGIAQWHPDRQAVFKKVYGKDIREAGFKEQLEFVNWELNNNEKAAGAALRAAKTAREAAIVFDEKYERSSGAHRAQRVANAETLMKSGPAERVEAQNISNPLIAPEGSAAPSPDAVPTEKGVATSGQNYAYPKMPGQGQAQDFSRGFQPGSAEATGVNRGITEKLSQIQSQFGAVQITSGYRDQQRNSAVGGARNSAHMRANALDVSFSGDEARTLKFIQVASSAGIGGIGVYKPGSVHIDTESRRVWGPDYTASSIPKWAMPALSAHMSGQMGQYDPSAAGVRREGIVGSRATEGVYSQPISGTSRTIGDGGYPQSPMAAPSFTRTSRAQIPGPIGMAGGMPGMGPLAGLLSTIAMGGGQAALQQSPIGLIGGALSGLLGALNRPGDTRNPNSAFTPDQFQDNNVPPAMPGALVMRELFDIDLPLGTNPVQYAFG